MEKLKLVDLVTNLQTLAHSGYALHEVKVHTKCHGCESDIILTDPDFQIKIDSKNHSVRISFVQGEEIDS